MGPELYSLAGKWKVKDGILVCDWRSGSEAVLPVVLVQGGPNLGRIQLPRLQWLHAQDLGQIVGVTRDALTLQLPDGKLDIWKRHEESDSYGLDEPAKPWR